MIENRRKFLAKSSILAGLPLVGRNPLETFSERTKESMWPFAESRVEDLPILEGMVGKKMSVSLT